MNRFVDVYDTRTGRKHRVPEHLLTLPRPGRFLRKTPRQRARDRAATLKGEASATFFG
jgi:hypothetical protein